MRHRRISGSPAKSPARGVSGGVGAFSLIEILVVVGIIGALMALAAPSMRGLLDASRMSRGTETIAGALSSARQLAVTRSRQMEVRLIECKDPDAPGSSDKIRGIQVLEVGETGLVPIGKPRMLPSGVIIGATSAMSSLADLSAITAGAQDPRLPGVSGYTYRAFRFRTDGSVNLNQLLPGTDKFYLTLFEEKLESRVSGATPPPNFATIQLEPATGATIVHRP